MYGKLRLTGNLARLRIQRGPFPIRDADSQNRLIDSTARFKMEPRADVKVTDVVAFYRLVDGRGSLRRN